MKKVSKLYLIVIIILFLIPGAVLSVFKLKGQSNTMKFVKAMNGVHNDIDLNHNIFGGIVKNNNSENMKSTLAEYDDITTKEELDILISYYKEGNYTYYADYIYTEYKANTDSWKEYEKALKEYSEQILTYYEKFFTDFEQTGKNFKAYELSSIGAYAAWGYVADYYTFEEAAQICIEAAKELQQSFTSWDEFKNNYITAMDFMCCEYPEYYETEHEYYLKKIETMSSLFEVPFDTELKLENMKESYASVYVEKDFTYLLSTIIATVLVLLIGLTVFPIILFLQRKNFMNRKLAKEGIPVDMYIDNSKYAMWLNEDKGELYLLFKYNPFKLHTISASEIVEIKIDDGKDLNEMSKRFKLNLLIDNLSLDIPVYKSSKKLNMDTVEMTAAMAKAQEYYNMFSNAKQNSIAKRND